MILTIIIAFITFVVGYLVGANNPLASVKKSIADAAKAEANKL